MNTKNTPLNELKRMLNENSKKNNKKKKLLEGYLSEKDFDTTMDGQQDIPQYEEDFSADEIESGDALAQKKGILPIKNEIDQIRQIALKTIARLAENPVSESYQMMKKIWIMCDKAIESALQPEENNSK